LELFSDDDWQAVTVEQIAERAEIGKGTVYKHFASKDEIYARLAADFQKRSLERLERIDRSLPVLQRLRMIIAIFWEQHRRGTSTSTWCSTASGRISGSRCRRRRRRSWRAGCTLPGAIDGVLQDGIDQGILPRKPREALVFGPMAALNGATRHGVHCLPPQAPPEQYLNELTNFILAGMLYQEWLAGEGLDDDVATRRALAEMQEVEAELESDGAAAGGEASAESS
jgi:AcrR family transcriptional regulator